MVVEDFTVHGIHAFGYGVALGVRDMVERFTLAEVAAYDFIRVFVRAALRGAKRMAVIDRERQLVGGCKFRAVIDGDGAERALRVF